MYGYNPDRTCCECDQKIEKGEVYYVIDDEELCDDCVDNYIRTRCKEVNE